MASSVSVVATFLARPVAPGRSVVMAADQGHNVKVMRCEEKKESGRNGNGNGRRELVAAVAAAAVAGLWSVGGNAWAEEEEPRRGSQEAKKKYAQVCVTMPTARICRY